MMVHSILVGFMGSGKTTVGRLLAAHLNCTHLDLDAVIVARERKSIKQIFADHGEAYFRSLESKMLAEALKRDGILSTGGGTPIRPANRQLLINSDIPVVYLKASPEVIINRLNGDQSRPLFQSMDKQKLIHLYHERESVYEQSATIRMDTDHKEPSEIVRMILKSIGASVR
ncbi:shikimate kinase [Sporolactobacillus shoreicorticis]|uniref:Shikimate kinase n=1 Tax=Sporolactobacillus shoreicorticis TaxID=1923877 RepID=A0ABW5S284_9BACL|nr:shikimate kinase [Sporolactobacillus shoreicorticis]MCO7125860.1 shikimate kinase [Sporolactobacillus shoreicorticis]